MPLTLEQYAADYLPGRGLPWPGPPKPDPPKARPHVGQLRVKAVLWTVYGTLLNVPGGELAFEAPVDFMMDVALDKTIQEFKMWQSMSRKPGAPAAYMKELYTRALTMIKLAGSGAEKFPEVAAERVWDDIVKKLQQKEYTFDAGVYGGYDDFLKKLSYFFHASIQGCGAYPSAAAAVRAAGEAGKVQGLLADGQCFTPAQLNKCLRDQDGGFDLALFLKPSLRFLSADCKARKPSETLFKATVAALAGQGIAPSEALHVGSSLVRDIGPAKRHGFKTALFAGDKGSLAATPDQLKDPAYRPDVMLTDLAQVVDILS